MWPAASTLLLSALCRLTAACQLPWSCSRLAAQSLQAYTRRHSSKPEAHKAPDRGQWHGMECCKILQVNLFIPPVTQVCRKQAVRYVQRTNTHAPTHTSVTVHCIVVDEEAHIHSIDVQDSL